MLYSSLKPIHLKMRMVDQLLICIPHIARGSHGSLICNWLAKEVMIWVSTKATLEPPFSAWRSDISSGDFWLNSNHFRVLTLRILNLFAQVYTWGGPNLGKLHSNHLN